MKKVFSVLLALCLVLALAACGRQPVADEPAEHPEVLTPDGSAAASGSVGTTGTDGKVPKLNYEIGLAYPMPSETDKNADLEKLIAQALPGKDFKDSTYYYNFANLNDDDTDEVAALVVDTAYEPDGGTLVLASKKDGKLQLLQVINGVSAPVIVSDATTNGWHDLILPDEMGNGWSVLCWDGKQYPTENSKSLATLENQSGFALFYNDVSSGDSLSF